jgi:hypothetical protein
MHTDAYLVSYLEAREVHQGGIKHHSLRIADLRNRPGHGVKVSFAELSAKHAGNDGGLILPSLLRASVPMGFLPHTIKMHPRFDKWQKLTYRSVSS